MLLQRVYICRDCNEPTIKEEENPKNPADYFANLPKRIICKFNDCGGLAVATTDRAHRE